MPETLIAVHVHKCIQNCPFKSAQSVFRLNPGLTDLLPMTQ